MSGSNTETALASRWLVTTDWLAGQLGARDLVVVDGSWYLPAMQRDAAAEYLAGHIPGAVRFDIDQIEPGSGLTNMCDRIEALGGTVAVTSAQSRGTRVRGSVPLD